MKIPVMLLVVSFTNAIVAMDNQSTTDQKQKIQNLITLKGIVAKNATGQLECDVTYDPTTNAYWGTLINNHYSMCEWHSQKLSGASAQQYYQQLSQLSSKTDEKTS